MALSIPQMARMSQLLKEALALDEAERRPWLERATREHPDLAAALRGALQPGATQAAELKALLSLPKLGAAEGANTPAASSLKPGARVGPYELIRLLGAGGMAEVWLARRADGAFKREVALKLPMLNRLQAGLEVRFARERDILAGLEHTHIARLYDAGVDPHGLPYLAMEYVQGAPLTDWCDAHRLAIPERLGLFLQVLEAVQYAHDKSVIHRDLKPSNILVTESGQVRLLDFGVARLLEAEETDQPALTSVYGRALTPDYASPELLRGGPIDARSDLYSLGVLIYELLTGARPYRLKSAASIGALDQAIATTEVKKPSMQLEQSAAASRASTPERLARQLRGDLDAVVLKALAKAPAHRYPSAVALAEDLRRYLDGKPIRARPARIAYRLRKFVLRNRALLGVSAVALAAILATVGYALYRDSHAQVTVGAKTLAVVPPAPSPVSAVAAFAPLAHSIAVLPFVNMSGDKGQEYFSDGLSEELIDMLTKIPDLRVPARTSSFYFKGKQATITDIAKALGVAHVLEGSVRKSGNRLRVTAQLIQADNGFHLWSETYDRHVDDIFNVQDEIATAVVGALKLKLLEAPTTKDRQTENSAAHDQYLIGRELLSGGNYAVDRSAAEAFRRAVNLDPNYAAAWAGLAQATYWAAQIATSAAEFTAMIQEAQTAAYKAVALRPDLADGYVARGFIRAWVLWDFKGAGEDYRRALTIEPENSEALSKYSNSVLRPIGRLDEAVAMAKQALKGDPFNADTWTRLGAAQVSHGDYLAARESLQRSLEINPEQSWAATYLAFIFLLMGDPASALPMSQRATAEEFRLQGAALAEHDLGNVKRAEQQLNELIAKYADGAACQIAEVYAWWGDKSNAFQWLDRAYVQHDGGLWYVKVNPLLKSLRLDPRYKAFVHKMNLPE
jgi:serine/threonine protein kinase/TolB-like protein/predicted Zn-dependent protease